MLIGPLSEVYGRNPIYRISYFVFFAFSWAVAFPPNIGTSFGSCRRRLCLTVTLAVYLIFRFLTGFSSSAFLSVAGGSVSDLFDNAEVAT